MANAEAVPVAVFNNIAVPYVPVNLDKPRKLIYDFNALALIEEKTGRSFMTQSTWTPKLADMRVMIWAGLIREDPTLDVKDVGKLVKVGKLPDLSAALQKAMKLTMGDADPNRKGNPVALEPASQTT